MEQTNALGTQSDQLGAIHESIEAQLGELEARAVALVAGPPLKPDPNTDTQSSIGATKEPIGDESGDPDSQAPEVADK